MQDRLIAARALLMDATPLKTDCGKQCGARCCRSLEGEETGMLLFPGEEEAYRGKAGWKLLETEAGTLAVCPGQCERRDRPLSCRLFPLLPVIREGRVKAAVDLRAKTVCPLAGGSIQAMDPDFRGAVREAGRILAEEDAQRAFLEKLTREQDELKALRAQWGGSDV